MVQRVLAFGSTGDQGSGLAEAIQAAGATPVLATSRAEQAETWRDAGAEAVLADLSDPDAVLAAARAAQSDAAVLHIPLAMSTAGRGEMAARSAVALTRSGQRTAVNVGTPLPPPGAPDPFGTGPLVELLTGAGVAVLGVTAYLENHAAPWVLSRLEAGELVYPRPADDPVAWIAARDVTAAAVAALAETHAGQAYQLAGPAALTFFELAAELAAGLDRPITFRQVSPAEYGELLRPILGDAAAEAVAGSYAAMPSGPNPLMTPDASSSWAALGLSPTPARRWAAEVLAARLQDRTAA